MNGFSKLEMEVGSASSNSPDSPKGLKFGKKIYPERVGDVGAHPKSATGYLPVTGVSQPFPAPLTAKKGRSGLVQGRRCQVEGCEADLSDVKAYYSRHKVCGTHSKSPMVIVAGLEQRFCQQCSRFHRLPEFDQGKRSCRRRLAGHNERRRKPPPGSLLSTCYRSLSSSIFESNSRSGSFLVDFTAYRNLAEVTWPNTRTFVRGWNNQTTVAGKFLQSPWLKNSENSTSDLILQGSAGRASYYGPGIPSGNCFPGVSDSSGALSLFCQMSPGAQGTNPLALGLTAWTRITDLIFNHQVPMLLISITTQTLNGDLKETKYSDGTGMAQHRGKQFMELEQSKGYDSSVQNVHWTL